MVVRVAYFSGAGSIPGDDFLDWRGRKESSTVLSMKDGC